MTLDSGNIRCMRIFPGVPWRGDVKRQWDNQKHRFSGLSDASWSYSKLYQMLKFSCRDHKTFSLHLGLHIGYKDYLLTYLIDQLHISYRNEH